MQRQDGKRAKNDNACKEEYKKESRPIARMLVPERARRRVSTLLASLQIWKQEAK